MRGRRGRPGPNGAQPSASSATTIKGRVCLLISGAMLSSRPGGSPKQMQAGVSSLILQRCPNTRPILASALCFAKRRIRGDVSTLVLVPAELGQTGDQCGAVDHQALLRLGGRGRGERGVGLGGKEGKEWTGERARAWNYKDSLFNHVIIKWY